MLRAVATLVALLALSLSVLAADPKPSRPLCNENPTRITYSQTPDTKTTVVTLGDDLGPSTLVASFDGTVYIYYREVVNGTNGKLQYLSDWNLIQTLESDNLLERESFGASLSLSGDVLAVGQPQWYLRSDQQSEYTGAVYLYRRQGPGLNYSYEDTIIERDGVGQVPKNARFGQSVSLINEGSILLVGAPGCCPFSYEGAAFTYTYGLPEWNSTEPEWYETTGPAQQQVLLLGQAVALADTNPPFVLMGSPGYDGLATNPGVYFSPINPTTGDVDNSKRGVLPVNALTITPAPVASEAECGYAISNVDEKRRRVIWSCPGFDGGKGATYTTDLLGQTWSTSRRITSPTPNGARFGQSVAYSDPIMVATEATPTGGMVHVFQVVPVTLKPEAYINTQSFAFANALGADARNITISVDVRDDTLAVGAYGELVIYKCPLPSAAASANALFVLVLVLAALVLSR